MPYRFNPLARFGFDYYEVSTGGEAGTGTGWSGEVTDYTYLPAASSHTGEVWLTTQASGIWPFKKKPGFYRSAGGAWVWLGFNTLTSLADVPTLPDSTNDYRLASIAGTFTWSPDLTPAQKGAAGEVRQVTGPAVDGLPDTATQAKIDQLLAAGWPDYSILWRPTIVSYPSASLTGVSATTSVGTITGVGSVVGVAALTGVSATTSVADITGLGLGAGVAALTGVSVATSVADITGAPNASLPSTPVISVTPGDTTNVIALTSGGTGATSYDIHWGTVSGTRSNVISSVTLPYTHTGRTNGTAYYYSLVAINGAGSVESEEVSGTPTVQLVTFFGAGALWSGNTTGAESVGIPAGMVDDDLMVITGNTDFTVVDSGWTKIDQSTRFPIYYKFKNGLQSAINISGYFDVESGGTPSMFRCFVFRPVNKAAIGVFASGNTSGNSNTVTGTGLTTDTDNTVMVLIGTTAAGVNRSVTGQGGSVDTAVGSNNANGSLWMGYKTPPLPSAGLQAQPTLSLSASAAWNAYTFALRGL